MCRLRYNVVGLLPNRSGISFRTIWRCQNLVKTLRKSSQTTSNGRTHWLNDPLGFPKGTSTTHILCYFTIYFESVQEHPRRNKGPLVGRMNFGSILVIERLFNTFEIPWKSHDFTSKVVWELSHTDFARFWRHRLIGWAVSEFLSVATGPQTCIFIPGILSSLAKIMLP